MWQYFNGTAKHNVKKEKKRRKKHREQKFPLYAFYGGICIVLVYSLGELCKLELLHTIGSIVVAVMA